MANPQQNERQLRIAVVWNGSVQHETVLERRVPVVFGDVSEPVVSEYHSRRSQVIVATALFITTLVGIGVVAAITELTPILSTWTLAIAPWLWFVRKRPELKRVVIVQPVGAEGLPTTLVTPSATGYTLDTLGLRGSLWLGGQRRELSELGGGKVELGLDDYGVVHAGSIAIFLQSVRAAHAPKGAIQLDWGLAMSFLLALMVHGSIFGILFLALGERDELEGFELPSDLTRRFMVTPPPEDLEPERASGTDTEDPGIRDREEAGGRQHEGEEGRVGREDSPQEQTEMEGEVTGGAAARVRKMGLLGVLADPGADDSPLSAVFDGPSVGDILGGLGSSRTVFGRGSGGTGLRGSGSGGGGEGTGTLFGGGGVGTGVGVGSGRGGGRGGGGAGAPGRPRGEVAVRMQTETPRVSGYLSPEQIMRVVRQNQAAVRYCYESELQRQPSLRGRIEIAWRINREGRVTTSRVARSTMGNARVEGCIVRQVRNWRFPEPDGGEVDVTFPFIFGATGG